MRGTDHYDKADGILADLARDYIDVIDDHSEYHLRVAAVHAELAVAGALAALLAECKHGIPVVIIDDRHPTTSRPSPLELERRAQ